MDRLMAMRIKLSDDTYSEEIPIGALISNIVFSTGETLQHYLNSLEEELDNIKKKVLPTDAVVGTAIVGQSTVGEEPVAAIGSATIGTAVIGGEESSDSNVLIIKFDEESGLLDKTFKQIDEAWSKGITCIIEKYDSSNPDILTNKRMVYTIYYYEDGYPYYCIQTSGNGSYIADTENDYPQPAAG